MINTPNNNISTILTNHENITLLIKANYDINHVDLHLSQLTSNNSPYMVATSDICNGTYEIIIKVNSNADNSEYTLINNTTGISYKSIITTNEIIFNNISGGQYRFNITNIDNNYDYLFEIAEPLLCSVSLVPNVFYLRCNGDTNGELKAVININSSNKWRTGIIKYEYMWMMENDTTCNYLDPLTKIINQTEIWSDVSTLSNIGAGKYIVNVRQKCISNNNVYYSSIITDNAEICQPKQLQIKLYPNSSINLINHNKLRFWATGGTLPYMFELFKYDNNTLIKVNIDETKDTVSGLMAGTYKMILKDYVNCVDSIEFEITQPPKTINVIDKIKVGVGLI